MPNVVCADRKTGVKAESMPTLTWHITPQTLTDQQQTLVLPRTTRAEKEPTVLPQQTLLYRGV